jgi:hypothetical protein
MAEAGAEATRTELTALFLVMASPGVDRENAKALVEICVAALSDLPLFAIKSACRAYLLGEIGDGKWAPKPGEIYQTAKRYLVALEAERNKIKRVLEAKVIEVARNPAVVAQAVKEAAEVAKAIRANAEPFYVPQKPSDRPMEPPEKALEWLEKAQLKAQSTPLPKLSPEVLAKLAASPYATEI